MHRIGLDCRQDIVYSRALSCLVPLQRNEYRFETVIFRAGICVRVYVQFYCYDVVSEYDVCESACILLIFPLSLFSPAFGGGWGWGGGGFGGDCLLVLVVAFLVGVRTEAPNRLFAKEVGLFIFFYR